MTEPAFHPVPHADGTNTAISFRFTPGVGPAIVFLPGYMSDMSGSKACALFDWARAQGRACLTLDYSGCGQSGGRFSEGSLSRWRDEVLSLIAARCPGPVVLVGSSMGGWLMLLVALKLGDQVAGLFGIAAAPDFTEWGYTPAQKADLAAGHAIYEQSPYGDEPTPTHPGFWADGQAHRLLGAEIALGVPVRLIHGQADNDVPWDVALMLADALRSGDVQVTLVKDGDHRLSRPADIALILREVAALMADLER